MTNSTVEAWHRLVEARDAAALDDILADDVVFHSPVVHTPQEGLMLWLFILTGEGITV